MTLNEMKDILKGDFSKITLEEGETHATLFEKAFNHAIKCVEFLESLSTDNMNLPEIIDGSTAFRIVEKWIEALHNSNLECGLEHHALIMCAKALENDRWHITAIEKPTEEKHYLCCWIDERYNRMPTFNVLRWSNDIYKVSEYDFPNMKGKAGFYMYDSEYGFIEKDCHYWKAIDWSDEP